VRVGLVGCTKTKADQSCQPVELYEPSVLFQKRREYVEENCDDWLILSAKHRVLEPYGGAIEPYNETLNRMTKKQKRFWSIKVTEELGERGMLESGVTFEFHAGKDYYRWVVELLEGKPVDCRVPMEGMQIGEQLSWYTECNDGS
jgi:hypothetical protein